jgi:hypothetical protein
MSPVYFHNGKPLIVTPVSGQPGFLAMGERCCCCTCCKTGTYHPLVISCANWANAPACLDGNCTNLNRDYVFDPTEETCLGATACEWIGGGFESFWVCGLLINYSSFYFGFDRKLQTRFAIFTLFSPGTTIAIQASLLDSGVNEPLNCQTLNRQLTIDYVDPQIPCTPGTITLHAQ